MRNILIFAICLLIGFACKQEKTANDTQDKQQNEEVVEVDSSRSRIEALNQQIVDNPGNVDLYLTRAKLKAQKRNFEEALKDVERALSIDSSKSEYFEIKGDIYFAKRDLQKASKQYLKATTLNPKRVDPHLKLAEAYIIVENYEEAVYHINNALKADVYNAKAYFLKGMSYKFLKDTVRAVSSFQTAVEQDPDFYDPYIQLGILYASKNNPLAEAYYNNALRIQPSSIEALYNKGLFYQQMEQMDAAVSTYKVLVSKRQDYPLAYYNMGYIKLVYEQQFDSAAYFFSNAISYQPTYFQAYYNRGLCNEYMGYLEQAAKDYKKALELKPNYTEAAVGYNRIIEGKPLKL